jgi:cell division protein FtsB
MKISHILLILLSLLAVLLFARLWVGTGSFPEIWELEEQIAQQTVDNEEKRLRNKQLESDVNELGKSNVAIEEHARSELGMVKKDETFYQVITREDKQNLLMSAPALTEGAEKNAE